MNLFGKEKNPLIIAVEEEKIVVVHNLLKYGVEVDLLDCSGKYTALEIATRKGNYALCRLLLKYGARPSRKKRKKGVPSALMLAAFQGDSVIVDLLLENGADPQEVCSLGTSSLMRIKGQVLRQLVEAGGTVTSDIIDLLTRGQSLGDRE